MICISRILFACVLLCAMTAAGRWGAGTSGKRCDVVFSFSSVSPESEMHDVPRGPIEFMAFLIINLEIMQISTKKWLCYALLR